LLAPVIGLNDQQMLWAVCGVFVVTRAVGLLPTLRGLRLREWLASWNAEKLARDETPSTRQLFRQGWQYAVSMLATETFERLDIALVVMLASVVDSGYYFIVVPLAALLTIAPNSLAVFTFNAGAEDRRIDQKHAAAAVVAAIVFQALSVVALLAVGPYLVNFFYGERFEPAVRYLPYILPAFAIKGYLQAMDAYLKGRGKPMIGVWARCGSILAMLAFVAAFFQKYKLLSIPMAAIVGQSLCMLVISYWVWRELSDAKFVPAARE
jgi:O-antigen/teichoic acid export membrane protein